MGLLGWAIIALIVSLIAGGLGFSGVAADAAKVSKFCFVLFLILSLVLFLMVLLGVGAVVAGTALVH